MPALTPEEKIVFLEDTLQMYAKHIQNLENVLMNLVVSIEVGLVLEHSPKLQRLVDEAKSVIDGEFEG
jgi:hypothetical protein